MRWHRVRQLRLMAPTRILLSDHHPSVRRGLRTILEATKQYEVCGEAGDGSQTLELATRLTPDILIMEISMPPPNGLDVAAKLRQSASETKILFVTMHDSEEMLHTAAAVGASGYLLKYGGRGVADHSVAKTRSRPVLRQPIIRSGARQAAL